MFLPRGEWDFEKIKPIIKDLYGRNWFEEIMYYHNRYGGLDTFNDAIGRWIYPNQKAGAIKWYEENIGEITNKV